MKQVTSSSVILDQSCWSALCLRSRSPEFPLSVSSSADWLAVCLQTVENEEGLGKVLEQMDVQSGQNISFENFWKLINNQALQLFGTMHKEKGTKCTCLLQWALKPKRHHTWAQKHHTWAQKHHHTCQVSLCRPGRCRVTVGHEDTKKKSFIGDIQTLFALKTSYILQSVSNPLNIRRTKGDLLENKQAKWINTFVNDNMCLEINII